MKLLFKNWRRYINEALLFEGRVGDAKKAIVKNLEKIQGWSPPYTNTRDQIDKETTFKYLEDWIESLSSSKHLVGLAFMVNQYLYDMLNETNGLRAGEPVTDRFGHTLKKVKEEYASYDEATDKRMKISANDFFDFQNHLRGMPGLERGRLIDIRNILADTFVHLKSLSFGVGDNIRGPIEPITMFQSGFSADHIRGPGRQVHAMDVFVYFGFILGEMLRERGYKKDPAVIEKAKETSELIVNNKYYTITQIHSIHAGCILGCSTWCISQIPSREQEDDPTLDDPRANRFNLYVQSGDKIYILNFKHLKKHKYQKVSMQFNIKRKTHGPWEVVDCGGNRNDDQRGESAIKMGIKYNILAASGLQYKPNIYAMLFDFEDFLKESTKKVSSYGYYEKKKYFMPIAKELGIVFADYSEAPYDQWELVVENQVKAVESLAVKHWRMTTTIDPIVEAMTMLFDCRTHTCTGKWHTVATMPSAYNNRIKRVIRKILKKDDPWPRREADTVNSVFERLQQEAGGPNVGAARNLLWALIRNYARLITKSVSGQGAGTHWVPNEFQRDVLFIVKLVNEWHWEMHILLGTDAAGRPHGDPDPVRWLERHADDLAEEVVNILIDINPATLMGHLGIDTDISEWLTDENNRDFLAAEIRRIFEENVETTIELVKALASENPQMAIEKTWELFYKSLGKEVGHLIDRVFGSDDDRAEEEARRAARKRENLQENKKPIRRINIIIGQY